MHKRTGSQLAACQDRYTADCRGNHMLFVIGVGIVSISVGIIALKWERAGDRSANLGWMSERWLAEHRASHSL